MDDEIGHFSLTNESRTKVLIYELEDLRAKTMGAILPMSASQLAFIIAVRENGGTITKELQLVLNVCFVKLDEHIEIERNNIEYLSKYIGSRTCSWTRRIITLRRSAEGSELFLPSVTPPAAAEGEVGEQDTRKYGERGMIESIICDKTSEYYLIPGEEALPQLSPTVKLVAELCRADNIHTNSILDSTLHPTDCSIGTGATEASVCCSPSYTSGDDARSPNFTPGSPSSKAINISPVVQQSAANRRPAISPSSAHGMWSTRLMLDALSKSDRFLFELDEHHRNEKALLESGGLEYTRWKQGGFLGDGNPTETTNWQLSELLTAGQDGAVLAIRSECIDAEWSLSNLITASLNRVANYNSRSKDSQREVLAIKLEGCGTESTFGTLCKAYHDYYDDNRLSGDRPLRHLILRNSCIASMAPGINRFEQLVTLNLSGNKLTSLEGLLFLPNLLHLNVSRNKLASLDHLQGCPLIRILEASDNQLVSLTQAIYVLVPLTNMLSIDFRENKVCKDCSYADAILSVFPILQYLDSYKLEALGSVYREQGCSPLKDRAPTTLNNSRLKSALPALKQSPANHKDAFASRIVRALKIYRKSPHKEPRTPTQITRPLGKENSPGKPIDKLPSPDPTNHAKVSTDYAHFTTDL